MPTDVPPQDTAPAGTEPAPPCTLVIFGAGGDLTKRLLMPSLYNLKDDGLPDDGVSILGIDPLDLDDEGGRAALTETRQSFTKDPNAECHVDYEDCVPGRPNVGYETLLYDCMIGDATLFQRADAIESAWAAVARVQKAWSEGAGENSIAVRPYVSGTDGPEAADRLLDRDGRGWLPLGALDAAS